VKVAVIGLGYVGLPLAVALARKCDVIGFDTNEDRVAELRRSEDSTGEVRSQDLADASFVATSDVQDLAGCEIFIVTVPTPIEQANRPDLSALLAACRLIGPALSKGSVVVFESTVYPGVTEEICGPELEKASGLRCGSDFKLGYSPERINPGDREHSIEKIVKVVAAQDAETLDQLSALYGSVAEAGIHRASSIKVAEAAKVIENTQRDLNIALMNELSKICDLEGIRTSDVLEAAATKWNFLNFHPGLVGGHCIGVDPYYLTARAEQLGYHPEVILAGRRINDGMGAYVAQKLIKLLAGAGHPVRRARVGILGLTFKANVPDLRNSKIADVYRELCDFGVAPIVHDPLVASASAKREYGIELAPLDQFTDLHALVLAVPHAAYRSLLGPDVAKMIAVNGVLIDIPSTLDPGILRPDILYWSL
jgi:UDP-N-acetyl-D-galactosamine dehydrogenase